MFSNYGEHYHPRPKEEREGNGDGTQRGQLQGHCLTGTVTFSISKWSTILAIRKQWQQVPKCTFLPPSDLLPVPDIWTYVETRRQGRSYAVHTCQPLRRWVDEKRSKNRYPKQYRYRRWNLRDNKGDAKFKETMTGYFPKWIKDLLIRYKYPKIQSRADKKKII